MLEKKNPCGLLREHISAFLNKLPLESEQLVRMLFFFFLLWKIIHHIWHYCSAPKNVCNDLWQQNILYYNYITKSFKTHSAQAFSQLKVLVYADICIYIVCMKACTYMHNLILSYGAFDIWVQKWNFYCSYLHTCLCTVQIHNSLVYNSVSLY